MIGPKKFTRSEREANKRIVRRLEQRVGYVDNEARDFCRDMAELSESTLKQVARFIYDNELSDLIGLSLRPEEFSPITPDIRHPIFSLDITDEDLDMLSKDPEYFTRLEAISRIMRNYRAGFVEPRRAMRQRQAEAHVDLLKRSMVEKLDDLEEKASSVLYVIDPDFSVLIKTEFKVAEYSYTAPFFTDIPILSARLRKKSMTAEAGDSRNVYLLSNPSVMLPAKVMFNYVIEQLHEDYANRHSLPVIEKPTMHLPAGAQLIHADPCSSSGHDEHKDRMIEQVFMAQTGEAVLSTLYDQMCRSCPKAESCEAHELTKSIYDRRMDESKVN